MRRRLKPVCVRPPSLSISKNAKFARRSCRVQRCAMRIRDTVSMYKISVPIFVQFLTALSTVLDKAAAHREAKKIEPPALLTARLFPDMFTFARQVRAATDHAANTAARLAVGF